MGQRESQPTSVTPTPTRMKLSAANLSKHEEDQFKHLPKEKRRDAMLKLAKMKIDAQEDASHLLSHLQLDMEASSAGRPGTGRSISTNGRPTGAYPAPPSTAGSAKFSIAGSLSGRIADSLLASEMRSRVNARENASKARSGKSGAPNVIDLSDSAVPSNKVEHFFQQLQAQNERPGTAASQLSQQSQQLSRPGTAASQRSVATSVATSRPPTAGQQQQQQQQARKMPELQLKPPILDPKELLPANIVQGFREEFRAKKAAEEAAAAAEAAAEPLGELTNSVYPSWPANGDRPGTGGSAGSRPLTGHTDYSMGKATSGVAAEELVVKAWAKKGRKPVVNRAAMSSIGECLAWDGQ